MKSIEAVIPTYRPGPELDGLLQKLASQRLPLLRIRLINTEESLFGQHVLPENAVVEHIRKEDFDHGATRDLGMQKAEADLVLFLTQDAMPADDGLTEAFAACFDDEHIASAYGRQLPKPGCKAAEAVTRSYNYPDMSFVKTAADLPRLGFKTYFCSDVCACYRRDEYRSLAGFPHRTLFNEDMIYAAQVIGAGYGIRYCAEARVFHSHNYDWRQQYRRNFDNAVSQTDRPDVFAAVPAESEGVRMVRRAAADLIRAGKWYAVPDLVWQSGWKFLGFRAGRRYRKMTRAQILRRTSDPAYWERRFKEEE